MVMMHVWFVGPRGHIGEFAGKNTVRSLFLLLVFMFSRNSRVKVFGFNPLAFMGWESQASRAPLPAPVCRY